MESQNIEEISQNNIVSNKNQLTNNLKHHCLTFKKSKNRLNNINKTMETTLNKYTDKEVQNVNKALEDLKSKVDKILSQPQVIELKNEYEKLENENMHSLENIIEIFDSYKNNLFKRTDLTTEQKRNQIKIEYEKIQNELLTPEEIETFHKLYSNIINIIPKRSYKKISNY